MSGLALDSGGHRLPRGVSAAVALCLLAAANGPDAAPRYLDEMDGGWSYAGDTGPRRWGDLSDANAACKTGRAQSPVDIVDAHPLGYTPLVFRYRSQLLEMYNTGQGVHVVSPPGSALLVRGVVYDLEEMSFHVPGEHRFEGVQPEGEIQFVHRDQDGGYVIVAAPLQTGNRENRILSRVLDYFPVNPGEHVRHRQVGINPLFLLPSGRGYFRYSGSLTTPPCTEPVLWYVLSEPLIISPDQLQRISAAVHGNARPAQPLNGRVINSMGR